MSYQYHTDLKAKATSKSTTISIKIDPKYADAVPQMTSKEYEELKQSIDDGYCFLLPLKFKKTGTKLPKLGLRSVYTIIETVTVSIAS